MRSSKLEKRRVEMFPVKASLVQSDIYSARKSFWLVFVAGILPDVLSIWSLDVMTNDKKEKYLSSGDEQNTLRFYTVKTFMEVPYGIMK